MKNSISMLTRLCLLGLAAFTLASCGNGKVTYDASGTFEATETIVSAEASGRLDEFSVTEGQTLAAGAVVGSIDSVQLSLRKKQLEAQIAAVLSRRPQIAAQVASLQEQLAGAQREQARLAKLVQADAATPKQYDDATTQVQVIKKQIDAVYSTLNTSTQSISEESMPLRVQIEQLNDQLAKCRLVNPVNGTVLTTYAEQHEVTSVGKALYKIADLSTIYLRAYVSGGQFSQIKLGQRVKVIVDNGADATRTFDGTISWISDKAEFTPKTIQTKDERANLVYAVKIRVKNDGTLKIGMYGEVNF
ncbi:MAG: HlyD family efflux transporter periplasmic adaptor subunit [Bacteroidetes bacterium]|nr:HlyD family efflux transporter periplasmic adaptor subunit [Bacteroidota bacterium]